MKLQGRPESARYRMGARSSSLGGFMKKWKATGPFVVALGIVCALACEKDDAGPGRGEDRERTRTLSSADTTTDVSFDLVYPAGYGVGSVPIGASDSLQLNDSVVIRAMDGTPGPATNAGSGTLTLGVTRAPSTARMSSYSRA